VKHPQKLLIKAIMVGSLKVSMQTMTAFGLFYDIIYDCMSMLQKRRIA
jgi:hypothetical protein